nr:MAG TPA: hypothetical protein [Caudoviricetes sp.]
MPHLYRKSDFHKAKQSPSFQSPNIILKSSLKDFLFFLASSSYSPPNSIQNA